jgi:hypothetical protein
MLRGHLRSNSILPTTGNKEGYIIAKGEYIGIDY